MCLIGKHQCNNLTSLIQIQKELCEQQKDVLKQQKEVVTSLNQFLMSQKLFQQQLLLLSQSKSLSTFQHLSTPTSFQQQPEPMSLGVFRQQTAPTSISLSTFQQQAVPMSVGMFQQTTPTSLSIYQQQTAPTSLSVYQQQTAPTSFQQQTTPTSLSAFQISPTTSLGALSIRHQGADSLPFEQTMQLQQSSSKQGPSMLQYSDNTSSAQHSDLETLLSDLDDIDDDYLSSSSSTINKSIEGHWKQPVIPSNQLQQNPSSSQGVPHEEPSYCPSPPPFPSPAKLIPVSEVLKEHPGSDVASLRDLTIALARDSIFGRDELSHCSLSGRKNTTTLDSKKLDYIKKVVYSRCPKKSLAEFEFIWGLCRSSLSKCCQGLRTSARRKL